MKLTVSLTNRAILLSGEDIRGDEWAIDCEVEDLSFPERKMIADRLYDDGYVCEGVVNEEGGVEPLVEYGRPVLLRLNGTELGDLTEALEQDEREVQEYLAQQAAKKNVA